MRIKDVYIAGDNIITSLGFTSKENCDSILNNRTGITFVDDPLLSLEGLYVSLIDTDKILSSFKEIGDPGMYTRFEKLAILSVHDAVSGTGIDIRSNETLLILSTTKGNIDLMLEDDRRANVNPSLFLWEAAKKIQHFFGSPNTPLVISNACVSGVMAISAGSRMIRSGQYKNAIVTGTDILSKFVISGFQSFQSLSNGPCRPFDVTRDGLSLGEGSGTLVLTSDPRLAREPVIIIGGGSSSNDANHISGPSRTAEGLYLSIQKTLADPISLPAGNIDYISAHGTATPFNDEMECIALSRAGLLDIPVNSYKGYWGHTLGAAGIIETVASVKSLEQNVLFKSAGFNELGVSEKIQVIGKNSEKKLRTCLKTASGFGGCNASLIFYKA